MLNVLGPEQTDRLLARSAYHRWLGLKLITLDEESVYLGLTWREEMIAHPERRYTHGGILAAFIDVTADYAIAVKFGRGIPTVDLRIDYHRAALPGDLTARGRVLKLGRTLSTSEASVFDREGQLLASGRGVYLTTET